MIRIAILDDYQRVALSYADWNTLGDNVEVVAFDEHLETEDLIAALQGVEVVVAMRERTKFPAEVLRRLRELRLIATTGARNVAIDMAACTDLGIVVSGTNVPWTATKELAWAHILSLVRHVPQENAAIRAGHWQQTVGFDLVGRTLGLAGLGRLGAGMVSVGKAFGMEVIAWSRNLRPDYARSIGAVAVTKEELLEHSDILSIHLVLSSRTRGLFGSAELAMMKPTAYLVNTSRGPIVDEDALVNALSSSALAGAGIDVYDEEPIRTDHPLLALPNTILTPHLGYVTDLTYGLFFPELLEDIAAYFSGSPDSRRRFLEKFANALDEIRIFRIERTRRA